MCEPDVTGSRPAAPPIKSALTTSSHLPFSGKPTSQYYPEDAIWYELTAAEQRQIADAMRAGVPVRPPATEAPFVGGGGGDGWPVDPPRTTSRDGGGAVTSSFNKIRCIHVHVVVRANFSSFKQDLT